MGVVTLELDRDIIERYAFCDPAAGKKNVEIKNTQCDSAIVVLGVDYVGRLFVLYSWSDRVRTDTLINEIMRVNDEWQPKVFGIEGNAVQSAFGDAVNLVLKERGKKLPYLAVEQPSRLRKEWRIRSALQPVLANGRVIFKDDGTQKKLLRQLGAFPRGQKVDELDALASCVMLVPTRKVRRERDKQAQRLARYLRSRGAPPRYIEQRLRAFASKSEGNDDVQ